MTGKKLLCAVISALMVLTMLPMQSFGANLPFTDVPDSEWYYSDVKNAWETGLIDGFEDNTFRPNENMTYAQAVKLAACMNQKYTTGSVTLTNGDPWYQSYVDYARTNHIISKDYSWNTNATRAGYVEIFANALPDSALAAKNSIADNAIPDVTMAHAQAASIYKLYRAGILTGMDDIGTFSPNTNIRRSEVSAILTRMMDESARKELTLGPSAVAYTVTFVSNGGSVVAAQSVQANGTAARPSDPVKAGYYFAGWYSDSALTKGYDFTTALTGNLTLYAKWVEVATSGFLVIFISNGGSDVAAQAVQENGTLTKPSDPVRNGFNFAGWYSDSLLKTAYDFSTTVSGNLTLYAKWDKILPNEYQVTFNSNGGSAVKAQLLKENEKAVRPKDPTRAGYDFVDWFSDSEYTAVYDFNKVVTNDLTVYAKWIETGATGTIQDSWEDIIASIDHGTYKNKYKLGDTKSLDLGAQGVVEMQIVAFDTDVLADGSGKAPITWISKELLKTDHLMNPTIKADPSGQVHYLKGTGTIGGWESSEMRAWLKSDVKPLIPSVVRNAIKPVTKYSRAYDPSGDPVNNMKSTDDVWIPSVKEMFGNTEYGETAGPSYTSCFQTDTDRIKLITGKSPDTWWWDASWWWLRSANNNYRFYHVYTDGTCHPTETTKAGAVALGFCL